MENITHNQIAQSLLVPPSPACEDFRSFGTQKRLMKPQEHDLKPRLWDAGAVLADAALWGGGRRSQTAQSQSSASADVVAVPGCAVQPLLSCVQTERSPAPLQEHPLHSCMSIQGACAFTSRAMCT